MICEVCGCTDERACFDPETELPCYWAEVGLCSVCARTRGPLMRVAAVLSRLVPRQFFPAARQHVLAAISDQVADDYAVDSSQVGLLAREEGWYCGDPSCVFCLEEGRMPMSEIRER